MRNHKYSSATNYFKQVKLAQDDPQSYRSDLFSSPSEEAEYNHKETKRKHKLKLENLGGSHTESMEQLSKFARGFYQLQAEMENSGKLEEHQQRMFTHLYQMLVDLHNKMKADQDLFYPEEM